MMNQADSFKPDLSRFINFQYSQQSMKENLNLQNNLLQKDFASSRQIDNQTQLSAQEKLWLINNAKKQQQQQEDLLLNSQSKQMQRQIESHQNINQFSTEQLQDFNLRKTNQPFQQNMINQSQFQQVQITPQMNTQMNPQMNLQLNPQMNTQMNTQMNPQMNPQFNNFQQFQQFNQMQDINNQQNGTNQNPQNFLFQNMMQMFQTQLLQNLFANPQPSQNMNCNLAQQVQQNQLNANQNNYMKPQAQGYDQQKASTSTLPAFQQQINQQQGESQRLQQILQNKSMDLQNFYNEISSQNENSMILDNQNEFDRNQNQQMSSRNFIKQSLQVNSQQKAQNLLQSEFMLPQNSELVQYEDQQYPINIDEGNSMQKASAQRRRQFYEDQINLEDNQQQQKELIPERKNVDSDKKSYQQQPQQNNSGEKHSFDDRPLCPMNKNLLVQNYGQEIEENKQEELSQNNNQKVCNPIRRNQPANNFDEVPVKGQQTMTFEQLLEQKLGPQNISEESKEKKETIVATKRPFLKKNSRNILSNAQKKSRPITNNNSNAQLNEDSYQNEEINQSFEEKEEEKRFGSKRSKSFVGQEEEIKESKEKKKQSFLQRGQGIGGGKKSIRQQGEKSIEDQENSTNFQQNQERFLKMMLQQSQFKSGISNANLKQNEQFDEEEQNEEVVHQENFIHKDEEEEDEEQDEEHNWNNENELQLNENQTEEERMEIFNAEIQKYKLENQRAQKARKKYDELLRELNKEIDLFQVYLIQE